VGSARTVALAGEKQADTPPLQRTPMPSDPVVGLAPAQVLRLQRSAGNAAVARFVTHHSAERRLQRCGANCSCGCERNEVDREELASGALLRDAVAARKIGGGTAPPAISHAPRQTVQRDWWTHIPVIGGFLKQAWCLQQQGHVFGLKAECMKEYNAKCGDDLLTDECQEWMDGAQWISDALLKCMKRKDPKSIYHFLEICAGAYSASLTD
jgi:hypothetical protein